MPQFNAALVPAPDQVVVRLVGDTDLSTAPQVTDVLTRAAELNTRQIVVDVARAHFWDCSGLHALAGFTRELSAAGRACRIVGALPATRRLIGMANLAGRLQLDGVPAAAADPAATRGTHPAGAPAPRAASRRPAPTRGAPAAALGC
ncbi:STAS domain-containing protein [Blastococcus mobilis]|uniref:Anti-anti-sigma factor n=1 Tax=Blastococcus mobilis TaxID=1938746 RepID=A0A238XJZ2_9ACTN|nr:STAS domain-containing protein [Blastococcus mobilis]SNR58654.1 anti-anti-sigma factor [Blastococcus mobilis]